MRGISLSRRETMKSRYMLFIGLGLGLIGVMVIGTLLTRKPYQFKGSVISPAVPAADFTLVTPDGGTFRLSDARGQVVILFFGYTHCPDECPATLANFKQIIRRLGDRSQEVTFLLITVDPEQDTPQVLGRIYCSLRSCHHRPDRVIYLSWSRYGRPIMLPGKRMNPLRRETLWWRIPHSYTRSTSMETCASPTRTGLG